MNDPGQAEGHEDCGQLSDRQHTERRTCLIAVLKVSVSELFDTGDPPVTVRSVKRLSLVCARDRGNCAWVSKLFFRCPKGKDSSN